MGLIRIDVQGSFGTESKTFSAQMHGHVDAVAQAIEWLSGYLLPKANVNDHDCHDKQVKPADGWRRRSEFEGEKQ